MQFTKNKIILIIIIVVIIIGLGLGLGLGFGLQSNTSRSPAITNPSPSNQMKTFNEQNLVRNFMHNLPRDIYTNTARFWKPNLFGETQYTETYDNIPGIKVLNYFIAMKNILNLPYEFVPMNKSNSLDVEYCLENMCILDKKNGYKYSDETCNNKLNELKQLYNVST